MKTTISCLLLALAFCSGVGYAAQAVPAPREADVKKDLDSIVSSCEKKKLPADKEIECIEQGYLEFLGEAPAEPSPAAPSSARTSPANPSNKGGAR